MPVKSKSNAVLSTKKQDVSLPPHWPPLKPLIPSADLSLETLLKNQIIVIRNFFTSSLCRNLVAFLSSLPLVTTSGQPKKGDAVRVNDRFQVDDAAFAEQLWKTAGLHDLLKSAGDLDSETQQDPEELWGGQICGLNPRIRIYRYSKGQFFAQHYDESNVLSLKTSPPTLARTTWTLLVYLTGPSTGCVGGETVFYPELGPAKKSSGKENNETHPIIVDLEVGREVIQGEKWVIRSDICVKR
ncbi:MAG: hypothetical protein Q9170_005967 [Blastenia crenularia]